MTEPPMEGLVLYEAGLDNAGLEHPLVPSLKKDARVLMPVDDKSKDNQGGQGTFYEGTIDFVSEAGRSRKVLCHQTGIKWTRKPPADVKAEHLQMKLMWDTGLNLLPEVGPELTLIPRPAGATYAFGIETVETLEVWFLSLMLQNEASVETGVYFVLDGAIAAANEAHRHGIGHLDIKIPNMGIRTLADGKEQIVFYDYGNAKRINDGGLEILTTPWYWSGTWFPVNDWRHDHADRFSVFQLVLRLLLRLSMQGRPKDRIADEMLAAKTSQAKTDLNDFGLAFRGSEDFKGKLGRYWWEHTLDQMPVGHGRMHKSCCVPLQDYIKLHPWAGDVLTRMDNSTSLDFHPELDLLLKYSTKKIAARSRGRVLTRSQQP
jgi:hypothetical protein